MRPFARFALAVGIVMASGVSPVWGQEEVEEAAPVLEKKAIQWGVGARVRYVFVPQSMLNLFLDHSTSMNSAGFGLEVVRRKENFDIVFGLEYENVSPKDGYYLEKGDVP